MGLLTVGRPLSWECASQHRKYVRDHGVLQFLNTYNRVKNITSEELLWGDEVGLSDGSVQHCGSMLEL